MGLFSGSHARLKFFLLSFVRFKKITRITSGRSTAIYYDMPPSNIWCERGGSLKVVVSQKYSDRLTAVLTVRADENVAKSFVKRFHRIMSCTTFSVQEQPVDKGTAHTVPPTQTSASPTTATTTTTKDDAEDHTHQHM
ncbi:hypothetical protein THRCLA_22945 [Thraustotheca clavata]|uniref:Uncharacterized protein n=1 Tax=Thraustotheca clavata TaxID=74557 RepID=A0A1V9YML8_9STRA|nr:hypothetical protein THRCLA_22945 [Thraustotheca clavata]